MNKTTPFKCNAIKICIYRIANFGSQKEYRCFKLYHNKSAEYLQTNGKWGYMKAETTLFESEQEIFSLLSKEDRIMLILAELVN